MSSPFQNSIFHDLLLKKQNIQETPLAILGGISGSTFAASEPLGNLPFVVFDFETTGLNTKTARIIEIGAIKFIGQKEVARFSQLVNPGCLLPKEIERVTGINDAMLIGQPSIQHVLPDFHDFLRGSVGVAHNAEFDIGMLHYESARLGIRCDYTVICTLKMARALVQIERRNLDSLAKHYQLTFESRHRSIGDILVTASVLWRILAENPHLKVLSHLQEYREFSPQE